ncbi:MAG: peptidylprolyl isomerase [Solirubrobacteraceae bacterium MAG38_C4-C5]|nr:peptidylprolyl isomerase [Candidatus Siliceabacter maunaloa]
MRPITVATLVSVGALGLPACGGEEEPGAAARTNTRATAPSEAMSGTGCRPVEAPAPKGAQDLEAPSLALRGDDYTAVMETNCGTIEIRLANEDAPETVASFVSLARMDFFDGLTFHRIAQDPSGGDFVIQGGDPDGTGQGGPGYSVVEAPPQDVAYDRYTVAMAKTEIEDPGTSGSQFFIVTGDSAQLPPDYALLGQVVDGGDTVGAIADVETDPTTEMPLAPVVIQDVTITEGDEGQ